MTALETLKGLYAGYLAETSRLERERGPWEGLMGFGAGPRDDKCHGEFINAVMAVVTRAAAEGLSSTQALDILNFMFTAPLQNADNRPAYWMLMALQGKTAGIIGYLDPDCARQLLLWYKETYPRRERFPAQKDVIAALKKRVDS